MVKLLETKTGLNIPTLLCFGKQKNLNRTLDAPWQIGMVTRWSSELLINQQSPGVCLHFQQIMSTRRTLMAAKLDGCIYSMAPMTDRDSLNRKQYRWVDSRLSPEAQRWGRCECCLWSCWAPAGPVWCSFWGLHFRRTWWRSLCYSKGDALSPPGTVTLDWVSLEDSQDDDRGDE